MSAALGNIRIVLARPRHPGNIGAAARAMKTMGLSDLVLVSPERAPDAESTALAVGADDILSRARVVDDLASAVADCHLVAALTARRRELSAEPMWAREAAGRLVAAAGAGRVALVFGNETSGLSNEEVALCHFPVMIPVNPDFHSLNLAAAVQVLSYELRLAAVEVGPPPEVAGAGARASVGEIDRFIDHLERAAIDSGFLDPAAPKRLIARMQRLFMRSQLEVEEVAILRGMLTAFEKAGARKD